MSFQLHQPLSGALATQNTPIGQPDNLSQNSDISQTPMAVDFDNINSDNMTLEQALVLIRKQHQKINELTSQVFELNSRFSALSPAGFSRTPASPGGTSDSSNKPRRKRKCLDTPKEKSNKNILDVSDSETSKSEDDSDDESKSNPSPPPIIIRNKDAWPKIQKALAGNDITLRRAVNVSDGVKIYPKTVDDFRQVSKGLEEKNIEYTTHQIKQERDLIVVIRGVNEAYSESEILKEIQMKIPAIKAVYRMRKGDKIWPLVVVHLDSSNPHAKNIFDLHSLGGLSIKVEPKRKSKIIPQCKRCQKFNHTANYCHASWVCAFCAKSHATPTCTKKQDKQNKPICANCSGDHWASYRGCPKAPKKDNSKNSPIGNGGHRRAPSTMVSPKVSYAAAVNSSASTQQEPNTNSLQHSLRLIIDQFVNNLTAVLLQQNGPK